MYSDIELPREIRAYLEAQELELQRPIRVLNGRGRRVLAAQTRDWNHGNWAASHNAWQDVPETLRQDPADRRRRNGANAITIVSYATMGTGHRMRDDLPSGMFTDSVSRIAASRDHLAPPVVGEQGPYISVDIDGLRMFEIHDHIVVCQWPLHHWTADLYHTERPMLTNLDLEILGTAIRRSVAEGIGAEIATAMQEMSVNNFVASRLDMFGNQRQTITDQYANAEREIADYTLYIGERLNVLRRAARELEALDAMPAPDDSQWREQWARFTNHPRISNVMYAGSRISFDTDEVIMTHPYTGAQRTLGEFHIEFGLGDQAGRSVFENRTNPRRGRMHPHVPNSTAACFGGSQAAFNNAMADADLFLLVELAFQYLESFNPEDVYGDYAALWFNVDDTIHPEFNESAVVASAEGETREEAIANLMAQIQNNEHAAETPQEATV